MKPMHLMIVLITTVLSWSVPANGTPVRWAANGHYYDVVDGAITWAAAKAAAESSTFMGVAGHLATINSGDENLFLTTTFGPDRLDSHWLGGFQPPGSPEPAGGWSWVTGEPFAFTNWFPPFEPNNAFGTEDALLFAHGLTAFGKTWNDGTSTISVRGYVVEFPVPSPPPGVAAFDRLVNPFATCSPDVIVGKPTHNTIQDAVDAAAVGDLIGVCSGTYAEAVTVATADVTIRPTGASAVHVVAPSAGGPSFGFDVTANGVTILGFEVSGFGGAAGSCGIRATGMNVTLTGNDVHDNVTGICLSGAISGLVMNNRIHDNHADGFGNGNGLQIGGGRDNTAIGNRVLSNGGEGLSDAATLRSRLQQNIVTGNAGHGIIANSSVDTRVSRNHTSDNQSDGITIYYTSGAVVDLNVAANGRSGGIIASNSTGCRLTLNRASDNAAYGVSVAFTSACVIDGNRVIRNGLNGIRLVTLGAENSVTRNVASGNGLLPDCVWDGSDAPDFANNACMTEAPVGAWD